MDTITKNIFIVFIINIILNINCLIMTLYMLNYNYIEFNPITKFFIENNFIILYVIFGHSIMLGGYYVFIRADEKKVALGVSLFLLMFYGFDFINDLFYVVNHINR